MLPCSVFQHGAGQLAPLHRLQGHNAGDCGPINHPQKNPSKSCWYYIVMAGITKCAVTPVQMSNIGPGI